MNDSLNRAVKKLYRLEDLARGDTGLHRRHPLIKLTVTMFFVVTVLSFSSSEWSLLMPFFLYPVCAMILADLPIGLLLQRFLLALPFVVPIALSEIILNRQVVDFVGGVPITGGVMTATSLLLKTLLAVLAVLIFIATTPMDELSGALEKIGCPRFIIQQFNLTYRYLSVLASEVSQVLAAYHLRAPKQKGVAMRDMGTLLGQLLLRSFDRATRVYQAMLCRGFSSAHQTRKSKTVTAMDWLFLSIVLLFLLFRMVPITTILGDLFGGI